MIRCMLLTIALSGCSGAGRDGETLNAATIEARADAIEARAENATQDSASQMMNNATPATTVQNSN